LESLDLLSTYKDELATLYAIDGQFPADNEAAGLPEPEQLIGNYLKQAEISERAKHLTLGNKVHPSRVRKIVSVRPLYVYDSTD
jgi:type IV pilus assembly protein PilA